MSVGIMNVLYIIVLLVERTRVYNCSLNFSYDCGVSVTLEIPVSYLEQMIYKMTYAKERFQVIYLKDSVNKHTSNFVNSKRSKFTSSDSLESKGKVLN